MTSVSVGAAGTAGAPVVQEERAVEHGAHATQPVGAGLRGAERISAHAARLFNEGLAAAAAGRLAVARDCFAAVVLWHPYDLEARSAYAFSCLSLGDGEQARRQWDLVLARRPTDERALRGLAMLAEPQPEP
jgi:Flp pilus assembly protein TadD